MFLVQLTEDKYEFPRNLFYKHSNDWKLVKLRSFITILTQVFIIVLISHRMYQIYYGKRKMALIHFHAL